MTIGIDPLVDFACKKLLGSPEHPAITLHFLNAVLGCSPRITDVEILNPIIEKEFDEDKYSILDVRARNAAGERFNIEIQRTRPASLPERLTYYVAGQLVEQIGAGQGYSELRPSIGICILDALLFPRLPDLHLDFRLLDAKHNQKLTDHLQVHLLELPKYDPPSDNVRIDDPIEQWCYFFRMAKGLTAEELSRRLPEAPFNEATGVLQMISRDPDQRSLYEARLKFERDVRAKQDEARQEGREEGRQEGRQEGEAMGLAKGEAIGKVKTLRQLLGEPELTSADLQAMSVEDLAVAAQQLQRRLRDRN